MPIRVPRHSKREASVTSGSANQAMAGESTAPVSATLMAIISGETAQLAATQRSGRALRARRRSPTEKASSAPARGISHHQPSHGPDASSDRARTPNAARR